MANITGTLASLAGTSTGIEPLYGLAVARRHAVGESRADVSPLLLSRDREE